MAANLNAFRNSDTYANVIIEACATSSNVDRIAQGAGTTSDVARTVLVDYQTHQRVQCNRETGGNHSNFINAASHYHQQTGDQGQFDMDKAVNAAANNAKHN
ncbi:MAG TPA: hypothetical protein VLE96_06270 [Chlamydiales bacterium]|nr:hypothetical protein [Chlamydiales bacterium]